MKVKYNGDTYTADFFDKLRIEYLKMILFLKRQKRRIKIMFTRQDLYLYLLITLFWSAFAVATFFLGGIYYANAETPYTIYNVLWELKSSYFSSVVLSLVISVYNRCHKYHDKIKVQHFIYTSTMDDFETILEEAVGKHLVYYRPLYCDACYRPTINYIKEKYKCGYVQVSMEMYVGLQRISDRLDKLGDQVGLGNVIFAGFSCVDEEMTLFQIDDAKKLVKKCMLQKCIDMNDFVALSRRLFFITNDIRTPWRRDFKNKMKILEVLNKYPENKMSERFYYNMFLNGCQLKFGEQKQDAIKVKPHKVVAVG